MFFAGNLFDDSKVLEWILEQSSDDNISELTSNMIEKLVREAKNVVVLFCKYAGYMLIAITHTCYMLRHYSGTTTATAVVTTTRHQQMYDDVTGDLILNGDVIMMAEQRPATYIPADRVKGMAMES